MTALHTIHDNKGSRKSRTRVGRGTSSGKGKTCGRGVKGQKSRSGVAVKGFEGGQMPLFKRLPKRGFTNVHRISCQTVNLRDLQRCLDAGTLDESQPVDKAQLKQAGLIRTVTAPVKLLGEGSLSRPLHIACDRTSGAAIQAVQASGGQVTLLGAPDAGA